MGENVSLPKTSGGGGIRGMLNRGADESEVAAVATVVVGGDEWSGYSS